MDKQCPVSSEKLNLTNPNAVKKELSSESELDWNSHKDDLPPHSSVPFNPSQLMIFDVDEQLRRASKAGKIVRNQSEQKHFPTHTSELVSYIVDDSEEVPTKPVMSFFKA